VTLTALQEDPDSNAKSFVNHDPEAEVCDKCTCVQRADWATGGRDVVSPIPQKSKIRRPF